MCSQRRLFDWYLEAFFLAVCVQPAQGLLPYWPYELVEAGLPSLSLALGLLAVRPALGLVAG